MSPTPSSSSSTTPEPLPGAVGGSVSPEPTGNGPAVNPETGIAPAGQPLTHLGGSAEYLEQLDGVGFAGGPGAGGGRGVHGAGPQAVAPTGSMTSRPPR